MIHIEIDDDGIFQADVVRAIEAMLDLLPFQSIVTSD